MNISNSMKNKALKGAIIAMSLGFTTFCGVAFAEMSPLVSVGRVAHPTSTSYGYGVTTTGSVATLGTISVSEITQTTATFGGSVTATGGSTIIGTGFGFKSQDRTNPSDGLIDANIPADSGVGTFSANATGLVCGTTYMYESFAKNQNSGIVWHETDVNGPNATFTTLPCTVTTVTTTGGGGGGGASSGGAGHPIFAPSDLNADGKTDMVDYAQIMANWGSTTSGNPADINKDGKVDMLDIVDLMANWAK